MSHLDLGVTGMTCTSCSARVERKLNKLEGVSASVNFATEAAAIEYDSQTVSPQELISVVEGAGYGAFDMAAAKTEEPEAEKSSDGGLLRRTVISGALSLPLMVVSMWPALQFPIGSGPAPSWQPSFISLVARLSTPLRGQTSSTVLLPWTRLSPWEPQRPIFGRCGRCFSATRANRA